MLEIQECILGFLDCGKTRGKELEGKRIQRWFNQFAHTHSCSSLFYSLFYFIFSSQSQMHTSELPIFKASEKVLEC